jgi:hypothetical protein
MRLKIPAYRLARYFQQFTNVKHPLRTSRLSETVPIKSLRQVERKTAGIIEFWPVALPPFRTAIIVPGGTER